MKIVFNVLGATAMLFGQVLLFENTEWGIKYLNAHPGLIKPLPLLVGFLGVICFVLGNASLKDAKLGFVIGTDAGGRKILNSFWGWLIAGTIVVFVINMLLE